MPPPLNSQGLPLRLVDHPGPRGICRARRSPGEVLADGALAFGSRPFSDTSVTVPDDAGPEAALAARLCERAARLVSRRFEGDTHLAGLASGLAGTEWPLALCRGHERLLDFDGRRLWLAADAMAALGIGLEAKDDLSAEVPERLRGFELLLALGLFAQLDIVRGASLRRSLHWVVDLYRRLGRPDQAVLLALLEGSGELDAGNLFSSFLRRGSREETIGRDRWITWLLGQDRLDLPYDRRAAGEILDSDADVDDKRLLLYGVLRDYDRDLEAENIRRLSREIRAAGQELVFGRMSRAFHNQGALFADAVRLSPTSAWKPLAEEAWEAAAGAAAMQSPALELRLLLEAGQPVSLIQMEGACERYEEASLDAQRDDLMRGLHRARALVEDHGDELAGPRQTALDVDSVSRLVRRRLGLVERVREELLRSPSTNAAYVVISQRPSPTGSHLLVKINEFEEPYLGKADNLTKLARLAGDRLYSSPDYRWLEVADHWIEAIPLFIKEEVLVDDEGVESTRTVIDIDGMEESFREEMADHWAANLRDVADSEYVSAARWLLCREAGQDGDEAAALDWARSAPGDPSGDIACAAALVTRLAAENAGDLRRRIEAEEEEPFEALWSLLSAWRSEPASSLAGTLARARDEPWSTLVDPEAEVGESRARSFRRRALEPRRPLPVLHVLTTQSAGMTDGYIRTWLEESMALRNVAAARGLEAEVDERRAFYRRRLSALGERVVRELGIWVEVEEAAAEEDLDEGAAVARVVGGNRSVQEEVAVLGALIELAEERGGEREPGDVADPAEVARLCESGDRDLVRQALERVAARNGRQLEEEVEALRSGEPALSRQDALVRVVEGDEDYRQDLESFTRFLARRRLVDDWSRQAGVDGDDRRRTYLRRFSRLAGTTARKQVLLRHGLAHLTLDPAYRWAAAGGDKRYHLLYTPSRVDLGHRERESVETWSQWVGGADRAAARAGREIYGLINKSVRSYDSLAEPEILKTGENASMASHFAFSNALSLMVSASGHGDIEEMGDQMSRRGDRVIHPAGEGYGGYCVPKDGLFLEFVLTLGRAEKLRQLGVPAEHHDGVAGAAARLLGRRGEFATRFEWEAWAAGALGGVDGLGGLFAVREGEGGPVPVFQITRLAEVLEGLGEPELHDAERATTARVARWGVHKMVAGAEHVNRFMPFYKVWLTRRALADAARRHPAAAAAPVVVLTAEYKPDTQDGRFAAGMRKFEILCGTADHLLYALDAEGQTLAGLLSDGFDGVDRRGRAGRAAAALGLDPGDPSTPGTLRQLFPEPPRPAEIRVVSPTGLSTQDLLGYTSDTSLEAVAEGAHQELTAAGFSGAEIEASLATYGPHLERWASAADIGAGLRADLSRRLSGRLHALALQVLGPERSYEHALQGADVLDTGIPHAALLRLLEDPAAVCRLMLEGHPDSALVIVDGASGARRRALNRLDVMLWFAAGERYGREPVYAGIGLGNRTVEGWRQAMRRQRRRARRLGEALRASDAGAAAAEYAQILAEVRLGQEAELQLAEVDKLRRFQRLRRRDELVARSLARLAGGLPLEELGFADFLVLGGVFLLDGAPAEEIDEWRRGLGLGPGDPGSRELESLLLHPARPPELGEFREEKGLESSNKAAEDRPVAALEARSQLRARILRARALHERHRGAESVDGRRASFEEARAAAFEVLGDGRGTVTDAAFGAFIAHARTALSALVTGQYDEGQADEAQRFHDNLAQLFLGHEIDPEDWRRISGGYEDVGDFGRLAQAVVEREEAGAAGHGLRQVAAGAELFYILLAVETTLPYTREGAPADPEGLWRALADFFAETVDDHFYEYRPWVYSRGVGFDSYSGDSLYELAVEHHQWLGRYLRQVVTRHTELAGRTSEDQDLLLGRHEGDAAVDPIGVTAASGPERRWRAYGQLRELAFMRNDGFPIPPVFSEFDPGLIDADRRVNHLIALPVGRTHYSRALVEGPTLSRELTAAGRPGTNLIISRGVDLVDDPQAGRPVVQIRSGHLYVSREEYAAALVRHRGLDAEEAREQAGREGTPKGIRLAVRFTRPLTAAVVYPFHGDPRYHEGRLEDCGLPYSVQSLFHTWTTYDKAKYPDIFDAASGVDVPHEIDWLAADTRRAPSESAARNWIENGLDGSDYPGLREFARRHRLVMIKDAAESGGRNARAFVLRRLAAAAVDELELERAVDFVHQISLRHNVAIQEVILSSPEAWATDDFIDSFVRRQVVEWGSAVERRRRPRSPIYGSHRVIVSSDDPAADLPLEERWHLSHWITLNSKQLITNVGRGGSLERFLPEIVQPACRQALFDGLAAAARGVMEALSAYAGRGAEAYRRDSGRPVGRDLTGLSYGTPRYMMLDFLVTPRFAEEGDLVEVTREPGLEPVFILQHGDRRFPGTLSGWRVVLIEPNIGVGLWDRVALREEAHERAASEAGQRPFDWDRVGENARVVLRDLSRAGEDYLKALEGQR